MGSAARAGICLAAGLLITAVGGCTIRGPVPPRPALSSYGCMVAVVRDRVPAQLPDKRAHCQAAGLIARYCSVGEAYLAGAGKELQDLLGGGDAEWADWRADRNGIRCARNATSDAQIAACCAAR